MGGRPPVGPPGHLEGFRIFDVSPQAGPGGEPGDIRYVLHACPGGDEVHYLPHAWAVAAASPGQTRCMGGSPDPGALQSCDSLRAKSMLTSSVHMSGEHSWCPTLPPGPKRQGITAPYGWRAPAPEESASGWVTFELASFRFRVGGAAGCKSWAKPPAVSLGGQGDHWRMLDSAAPAEGSLRHLRETDRPGKFPGSQVHRLCHNSPVRIRPAVDV